MTMKVDKLKERLLMTLAIAAMATAGLAFWKLVSWLMWLCYYAGIPM